MNLAEFLRARISEDESVARSALNAAKWVCVQNDHGGDLSRPVTAEVWTEPFESALTVGPRALVVAVVGAGDEFPSLTHDTFDARHIARFDPQRMLAECEAKKSLAENHDVVHDGCPGSPTLVSDDGEQDGTYGGPCLVLRQLASVYAGHPDYDESWRP